MKHICFFNSIAFWGGGEKLHLDNAIAFYKLGYKVSVYAHPQSLLSQKAHAAGLICKPVEVGNLSFLNPFKIVRLSRLFKQETIDTVIFSSSQDFKMASIAAHLAGVKNIVYLRGLAVPIKNSFINRFVFKRMLTHIIPNSEETKRQMFVKMGEGVSKAKVKVIYHGIDIDTFRRQPQEKMPEVVEQGKGVILGNAGRLTAQKGQDKLIEVAKILHRKGLDFTLFIAGAGEEQTRLQNLIDSYQLQSCVKLLGFVEDMELFMNSIDVFLLSSAWEGFGFVLVEAMIKAKPIVAFDITSNPEIVDDKGGGFLVPFANIDLFANKTARLIQSPALRQQMGTHGQARVHQHFILKDKVAEIEAFLKN